MAEPGAWERGNAPHCGCVGGLLHRERRVPRHEEMTPRRGDEARHQPHQVVVHVPRVPECGGGCGHHGCHQRVHLPATHVRPSVQTPCSPHALSRSHTLSHSTLSQALSPGLTLSPHSLALSLVAQLLTLNLAHALSHTLPRSLALYLAHTLSLHTLSPSLRGWLDALASRWARRGGGPLSRTHALSLIPSPFLRGWLDALASRWARRGGGGPRRCGSAPCCPAPPHSPRSVSTASTSAASCTAVTTAPPHTTVSSATYQTRSVLHCLAPLPHA
jgi:hypothetical protein